MWKFYHLRIDEKDFGVIEFVYPYLSEIVGENLYTASQILARQLKNIYENMMMHDIPCRILSRNIAIHMTEWLSIMRYTRNSEYIDAKFNIIYHSLFELSTYFDDLIRKNKGHLKISVR